MGTIILICSIVAFFGFIVLSNYIICRNDKASEKQFYQDKLKFINSELKFTEKGSEWERVLSREKKWIESLLNKIN